MEKHKPPSPLWMAQFALEPAEKGNTFTKGCFWGLILSSAFWLVILQLVVFISEG